MNPTLCRYLQPLQRMIRIGAILGVLGLAGAQPATAQVLLDNLNLGDVLNILEAAPGSVARESVAVTLACMLLWGLGSFPAASAQQVRLVALDSRLATVSLAVNTSGTYIGSAIGTVAGSALLASFGYDSLNWGGLAVFAVALALHGASTRIARP